MDDGQLDYPTFARRSEGYALRAFDELPDIYFFVKDHLLRFVFCNKAFLKTMQLDSLEDLIGKRDEDLSPSYLVERYRKDDMLVLASGARLANLIELVHNETGGYDWFHTTKFPARDENGHVIGVVGITRNLTRREAYGQQFRDLAPAVELMMRDCSRALSVEELAASVSLSPSQFRRQFRARFMTSPHQYIQQVRITVACELLSTTDLPLAAVAAHTGFFDQSHLTNTFMAQKGVTPGRFRKLAQAESRSVRAGRGTPRTTG